jgi:SAM-dependent methyltransferase
MNAPLSAVPVRCHSYGESGLSLVDRLGVFLSRRAIEGTLGPRRGLAALDLGCGYRATLLRALGPRLEAGVGVDVRVAPEVQEAESGRLRFLESTIEEALPALPSASFDVILLISVLEHLREPLEVLAHCRRLARPGALVLINVPTWLGKAFLEFSAFRLGTSPAAEMDDHKMYYAQRDLWPLLVRAGFRPSRIGMKYHKFGLNLWATAWAADEGSRP